MRIIGGMATTPAAPLARFRAELYQTVLGPRRDALFELLDAVLSGERAESLVRHSLAPCFRRGWASVSDALADGGLDVAALRRLFVATMPTATVAGRLLWVLDGTIWPRPAAKTSPDRTWGRWTGSGLPESGIVGAWEYQWLVAVPEPGGSWVLPLELGRRDLAAGTATTLAIRQLRAAQAAREADAPRPLLLLDSHYDVGGLVAADLGVDILARVASNRRFYRPPGPYSGKGPYPKHGPAFRCADPPTHGVPDRTQSDADPLYGQVTIDVWARLHTQPAPTVELTVLRVTLARLPRRETAPKPLWLVWHGGELPADLRQVWRWYQRRFAVEHAFRFLKQTLGWTTPRPRSPQRADRWSWLLAAALWQLWLARALVADARLPWERPAVPDALSPGRVRRGLGRLFLALGTPAKPPRPRGKAPGRRLGQGPGPAPRHPVLRRGPPKAA
jgi:hypothetical protein